MYYTYICIIGFQWISEKSSGNNDTTKTMVIMVMNSDYKLNMEQTNQMSN